MINQARNGGDALNPGIPTWNPNMVASTGSVLSPGQSGFVPYHGPYSYAQAAGAPRGPPLHPAWWSHVPWYGPEASERERMASLHSREWRGPPCHPTMPYKQDATHKNGPYNSSHGSRPKATPPNRARRQYKKPANKGKQAPKGLQVTFGRKSLKAITVQKLESLILKELNLDTLPLAKAADDTMIPHMRTRFQKAKSSTRNELRFRLRRALRTVAADAIWHFTKDMIDEDLAKLTPKQAAEIRVSLAIMEDKLARALGNLAVDDPKTRKTVYAMAGSTTPRVHTIPEHEAQADESLDLGFAERPSDANLVTPIRSDIQNPFDPWTSIESPREESNSAIRRLREEVARNRRDMEYAITALRTPHRSGSTRRDAGLPRTEFKLLRPNTSSQPIRQLLRPVRRWRTISGTVHK